MKRRNTKKTTDEFKNEVFSLVGNEYTILGNYINKDTKILFRHNECGFEFDMRPHNFLSCGSRCPECAKTLRKENNKEVFAFYKKELDKKGLLKYIDILNEFSDNDKILRKERNIRIRIKETNEIHTVSMAYLLKKNKITKNNFILNNDSFQKRILNRNPNLIFLSNYCGNKEYVEVSCSKCGHIFKRTANNLMTNSSCPKCNKTKKQFSEEEIMKRLSIKSIDIDDYEIDLSSYKNNRTPIKFIHKKCQTEFTTDTHSFIGKNKTSCPYCRGSYYEKYIQKWLEENNIKFKKEFKMDECRKIEPLPFDFYLYEYDILIEYDGRQHFIPIYGEESFKSTQESDQIKNKFCSTHNLKLIRIPYYLYNYIDTILNKIKNKENFVDILKYIELQGSTTIPNEVVKFHNRSRAQEIE